MTRPFSKIQLLGLVLPLFSSTLLFAATNQHIDDHLMLYADFLYMKRTMLHGKGIASDSNKFLCTPCSDHSVLNTKRLLHAFDYEPGYRIGLFLRPNKKRSIELSYFTLHEWKGKHTTHGDGTLSFPFNDNDTTDYLFAEKVKAMYRSHIYNGELNYWHHASPRDVDFFSISGIFGLRYFYLKEDFAMSYHGGSDTSDYDISSRNYIGALQFGANMQMNPVKHWSWDFTIKIGPTLAYEQQRTFIGDVNNTETIANFKNNELKGGFFGDVLIGITYKLFEHLHFRAGYEVLYLTNVALAAEQIQKHYFDGIFTKGEILLNGLYAGATLTF